jgi:hypothetical protein
VVVGDGASTKFWTDRWLPAGAIPSFTPNLFRAVGRRRLGRSVRDALADRRWVRDITGARTVPVLCEYVRLWMMLRDVQLRLLEPDRFVWRWTADGQYSVRSMYRAYFVGWTSMAGALELCACGSSTKGQILLLDRPAWTPLDRGPEEATRPSARCDMCLCVISLMRRQTALLLRLRTGGVDAFAVVATVYDRATPAGLLVALLVVVKPGRATAGLAAEL